VNPWQFLPAFVLGLVFGWWFLHTRSLAPCLLGHALHNGLPVLLMIIPFPEIPGYTGTPTQVAASQPIWLTLLGLACFGVGMALTVRQFRTSAAPTETLDVPPAAP